MSERSKEKRNLILKCAEQVFRTKGFSNVTMKDIIDECNISRGGIYLYFSSVDEIFIEVIKQYHKSHAEKVTYDLNSTKDFIKAIDQYFEDLKYNLLNIDDSLKLAMIEFFFFFKNDQDKEFFEIAVNGLKQPIMEIIIFGKGHGILPYELTNDLVELVVFWFIGLEEIMLSAHLSNTILEKQIQIMKNLILTGKIL